MRALGVLTCSMVLSMALAGCTAVTGLGDLEYTREPPPPSDILWAKSYGDAVEDWAEAVAIAPNGDVMIAGAFAGTVDFGGGEISSGDFKTDAFVVRLDPSGGHVYSARFDGGADDCVMDAALTPSGRAVALIGSGPDGTCVSAGTTFGISLGLQPLGLTGFAVRVLDPAGVEVATKVLCTACVPTTVGPIGLAVDGDENIYVTGSFSGMFDLGGGALMASGAEDVFVAKLDRDGNHIWSTSFLGEGMGYASTTDISVDPAGRVVVTGVFSPSVSIAGTVYTGVPGDSFVAELDAAAGTVRWSKLFRNAVGLAAPRAVAIPDGVLLTGDFLGQVSFGGPPLVNPVAGSLYSDAYLAKLDTAGSHVWSIRLGEPPGPIQADQAGTGVAIDAAGNIYMVGAFLSAIDLGGTVLEAGGIQDTFVAKLNPSGTVLSTKQWKGDLDLQSFQADQAIAVTPAGEPVTTGAFAGELTIDEQKLTSQDQMAYWDDAFAVRFSLR